MVVAVDARRRGGGLKPASKKTEIKKTPGESFVLFVICFVELVSVDVLWKQTQTVKKKKEGRGKKKQ